MKFRKLSRTGLNVSEICLGTMTWGRQNTQAEGFAQMDYALEQGINFFDTAEMYAVPPTPETQGKTEEIIGNWFADRKKRDQVILASKIAGPGIAWIRDGNSIIDRKNITQAVESSLKRLQTDYIDLYQLHWPNRGSYHFGQAWDYPADVQPQQSVIDNFIEVLETLQDCIKQGKLRHIGLSNETAWGTMQYLKLSEQNGLPRMASIQNEYSLLCRLFEPELSEVALYEDIGLLAWSPLVAGAISGKYLNGALPEGSRRTLANRHQHRANPIADAAITAYINVAKKHGLDVCQMAIAFVLTRKFVTSAIIGATSMDQLKMNIAAKDIKLSQAVLDDIETVRRQYPIPY